MQSSGASARVRSYAKLNLHLQIIGARPDGYHNLCMINTGIDLADELEISLAGDDIEIVCDDPRVPPGPENLCHRAAEVFFKRYPKLSCPVRVKIAKHIPVAGGLGGGSGNAAAVLVCLSRLTGASLSKPELLEMGVEIGADVPFFLFGSPAAVSGKGEVLKPLPPLPEWYFVLVSFDFGVSSGWAFSQWDLTTTEKQDNLKCLEAGDILSEPWRWKNDLEPVVSSRYPEVARASEAMREGKPIAVLMSGSGPTVFGVFNDKKSAHEASKSVDRTLKRESILTSAVGGPMINVLVV